MKSNSEEQAMMKVHHTYDVTLTITGLRFRSAKRSEDSREEEVGNEVNQALNLNFDEQVFLEELRRRGFEVDYFDLHVDRVWEDDDGDEDEVPSYEVRLSASEVRYAATGNIYAREKEVENEVERALKLRAAFDQEAFLESLKLCGFDVSDFVISVSSVWEDE